MLEEAVRRGTISAGDSGVMYQKYARSFEGYTYLTTE
jgi:hypothetical protein